MFAIWSLDNNTTTFQGGLDTPCETLFRWRFKRVGIVTYYLANSILASVLLTRTWPLPQTFTALNLTLRTQRHTPHGEFPILIYSLKLCTLHFGSLPMYWSYGLGIVNITRYGGFINWNRCKTVSHKSGEHSQREHSSKSWSCRKRRGLKRHTLPYIVVEYLWKAVFLLLEFLLVADASISCVSIFDAQMSCFANSSMSNIDDVSFLLKGEVISLMK